MFAMTNGVSTINGKFVSLLAIYVHKKIKKITELVHGLMIDSK